MTERLALLIALLCAFFGFYRTALRIPLTIAVAVMLLAGPVTTAATAAQRGADHSPDSSKHSNHAQLMPNTHQDHNPKHGGIFFMALDMHRQGWSKSGGQS